MKEAEHQDTQPDARPIVEWVAHPARNRPVAAVLVAVFVAMVAIGIYSWTCSVLFTVLASVILTGSLAGFYFPTRYEFHDDKVVAGYTLTTIRKEWSQFRSFYRDGNGVLLSPFPSPSRLENFRGLYLRFGECDRERVMEFIRTKIVKGGDGS